MDFPCSFIIVDVPCRPHHVPRLLAAPSSAGRISQGNKSRNKTPRFLIDSSSSGGFGLLFVFALRSLRSFNGHYSQGPREHIHSFPFRKLRNALPDANKHFCSKWTESKCDSVCPQPLAKAKEDLLLLLHTLLSVLFPRSLLQYINKYLFKKYISI